MRREVWVLLMRIIDDTSERSGWRVLPLASGMALAMLSACTTPSGELGGVGESASSGASGSDGADSDDGADSSDGDSGGEETITCTDVAASEARLLTRVQYANTIRDLFGLSAGSWTEPEQHPWTISSHAAGPFDQVQSSPETDAAYAGFAAEVASAIEPAVLLPCAADTPDPETCANTLVLQLGRAVWRRPLLLAEISDLLTHYDTQDLTEGTRSVVEDLLSSPNFYTLREQGTPSAEDPDVLMLDDYSLAARLSYFLWNSTPDAGLLDLADAGALGDPTALEEQILLMLADSRADLAIGEMYAQMFDVRGLDGLSKADPIFEPSLGTAMETEFRMLAADLALGEDPRLATLLQSPQTFVDADLLALYGADVISTDQPPGANFERAQLDPARRGGLLTVPAVMARYSSPAQVGLTVRGLMIREALLCQLVPPEPPGVEPDPISPSDDRYELIDSLLAEPTCGVCHQMLEGPHVAFDNYDELGRWQAEIDDQPVQSEGELVAVGGGTVEFDDRAELAEELLNLPELRECMTTQYLRFALRRSVGADGDACTIEQLTDRMDETDGDLLELVVDIARSDAFRRVRPE